MSSTLSSPIGKFSGLNLIIGIPNDVLYKILTFIDPPYNIASILCKSIIPLCHETQEFVNSSDNDDLWELILGGYYLSNNHNNYNTYTQSSRCSMHNTYHARTQRRSSKRLRRTTAKEDVIHAHFVLRDQTEMALQELADLAISKTPSPLSLSKLRKIFKTYGPNLHINQRSSIGSTFLVDVLRARHVKESVILSCVKELVKVHNASLFTSALVDHKKNRKISCSHSKSSSCSKSDCADNCEEGTLPPLVIAAARGMSSIVKFILSTVSSNGNVNNNDDTNDNADTNQELKEKLLQMKGTSRFRLYSNPKKSIHGTYTALEFVLQMKQAEVSNGANESDLKALNDCIKLLSPSVK